MSSDKTDKKKTTRKIHLTTFGPADLNRRTGRDCKRFYTLGTLIGQKTKDNFITGSRSTNCFL